jgi:crotonobetainyl-CoA:carnitine CoA-transferase CaiB-like acyl-CoA transferase
MTTLQIADVAGGALPAAVGILAALLARNQTGRGQQVDVSMLEGTMALMVYFTSKLAGGVEVPAGARTELTGSLPCYDIYRTRDGRFMALGALEPKFWKRFCEAIDRPDLIKLQFDEKAHREVRSEVGKAFGERTFEEWCRVARETDMCLEPVLSPAEALEQPLVKQRGFVPAGRDATRADRLEPGFPARLSETPAAIVRTAPALGQHTAEVLGEIGISPDHRRQLARSGATQVRGRARRFGLRLLHSIGWSVGDSVWKTLFRRRS